MCLADGVLRTFKSLDSSVFDVSDFAERLRSLKRDGQSTLSFARDLEIGDSLMRQYLAGAMPRLDKLIQIANGAGVSITWLATGEGARDSASAISQSLHGTQQEQRGDSMFPIHSLSSAAAANMVVVPIYDAKLSAGPGVVAVTEEASGFAAFDEKYLRSVGVSPRHARLMQVAGRSMFPALNDGEWVVVDTSVTKVSDDGLYAVGYGDSTLVKRVQMMRDGGVLLASDNKAEGYHDERVPRSEIHELRIIGRVKQHLRTV